MRLTDIPLWFWRTFAITFGLLWGSFLNVVIYRTPRELSVISPGSRCPGCETPIRAYDNIPVLSYVVLRGRARCCGAKMSARYPLVELLGGAMSLAIFELLVRTLPASTSLSHAAAIYFVHFALCMGLIAAAFIDLEHMYLPDTVTLGGAALGIASAGLRGMTFLESAVGAAGGFLLVWLPFIVIYPRIRGRQGMGMGDAKLMAMAGAWLGAAPTMFVLCAGGLQGALAAVGMLLVHGKIKEPEAVTQDRAELKRMAAEGDEEAKKMLEEDDFLREDPAEGVGLSALSFGPYLILAFLEWLFAGDVITGWILPPL
jgi:leader peptidase (prepilin peptidase)/N-methyltransferase